MVGHRIVIECLAVGVADEVAYAFQVFTVHVCHGIAAATAHTNHLDQGGIVGMRQMY